MQVGEALRTAIGIVHDTPVLVFIVIRHDLCEMHTSTQCGERSRAEGLLPRAAVAGTKTHEALVRCLAAHAADERRKLLVRERRQVARHVRADCVRHEDLAATVAIGHRRNGTGLLRAHGHAGTRSERPRAESLQPAP